MNEIPSAERQEHAPSPAGASVESHNASEPTGKPENRTAGDGCCVSPCSFFFIQTEDQSESGSESSPVSGTPESSKVDLVSHPDAAKIWARAQACPVCLEELARMTKRPTAQLKRFLDRWTTRGQPDPQSFWSGCQSGEEDRILREELLR